MSTLYTDLATLKAYIGIGDTASDTNLTSALNAACRAIDSYTGRRFYLDSSATARTYQVRGRTVRHWDGEELHIDDIGDTAGLIVETGIAGGSTWTATTDYETFPENAIARGRPIRGLRRILMLWYYGDMRTRVRVTAKWGWPAVPDDVVQAALIQATRLYRRKDSPEGVAGSADWGIVRMSKVDPDVESLVAHYKIPTFG